MIKIFLIALLAFVLGQLDSSAMTVDPKNDNEVIAIDSKSGRLIWTYIPHRLTSAHFEVYAEGLVLYPHSEWTQRDFPVFLNRDNASVLKPFKRDPSRLLAQSRTLWPAPPIRLNNGWVLKGFDPGNSESFEFFDEKTKRAAWTLPTPGFPVEIDSWKDLLFFSLGESTKDAALYAYRAGAAKPAWKVQLDQVCPGKKPDLWRMSFRVIDDVLYVEAGAHIFAFASQTGKLLWQKNLGKILNLEVTGGFAGSGISRGTFTKSGNILVVAFDQRVVSIDLSTRQILWQFAPDVGFQQEIFPVAYDGKVFLISGKNRQFFRKESLP